MRLLPATLAAILVALFALPARACGPDTDCRVGGRSYRIALPEGAAAPVGAVIFAHGYRGTATGVMRNKALRRVVAGHGLALIALQTGGDDWTIPYAPGHADADGAEEFAYVDAVIGDAANRFGVDTGQIVAAGFSAGGMLVWNLACAMPGRFAGFVAVSGTFWRGPPESCASPPASLVHIHGEADTVVPLTGRPIRETWQGDVAEVLAMYARVGGFRPAGESAVGTLRCRQSRNEAGALLDFCLHPGGHSFRAEYLGLALDRLRAGAAH